MTPERYKELQDGPDPQVLTKEELKVGWHWCNEMDGLLCISPSEDCFCNPVSEEMRQQLEYPSFDFEGLFN